MILLIDLRQWIDQMPTDIFAFHKFATHCTFQGQLQYCVWGWGGGEREVLNLSSSPYLFYFLHSCLTGFHFLELFLFKKSYAMNIANFAFKYFLTCTLQVWNKFIDCNRVFVSFLRMDLGLFTGWAAQEVLEQQFVSTWKVMNQMNRNTFLMLRYGDDCNAV